MRMMALVAIYQRPNTSKPAWRLSNTLTAEFCVEAPLPHAMLPAMQGGMLPSRLLIIGAVLPGFGLVYACGGGRPVCGGVRYGDGRVGSRHGDL
jgi:hypothetical protein